MSTHIYSKIDHSGNRISLTRFCLKGEPALQLTTTNHYVQLTKKEVQELILILTNSFNENNK